MGDNTVPDAKALLISAVTALDSARESLANGGDAGKGVAYYCQQTASKAVGAFVVFHDGVIGNPDDVEDLIDRASEIDPRFHRLATVTTALTPYLRRSLKMASYPVEPPQNYFREALRSAETIHAFVLQLLPPSVKPQ